MISLSFFSHSHIQNLILFYQMTISFYSTWSSSKRTVIKLHDMDTLHYTGPFFLATPLIFHFCLGCSCCAQNPFSSLFSQCLHERLQGLWLIYGHYK